MITCTASILNKSIHLTKKISSYIRFLYMSTIENVFNLSMISSFLQYIHNIVIILWSPSIGKSPKLAFSGFLNYFQLSNAHSIELILNLYNILLVKQSIGSFVKSLGSYSIGKSPNRHFEDNLYTYSYTRVGRSNWTLEVTGEGGAGGGFLVYWDGDRWRLGGRMILWGYTPMSGAAGQEWAASPGRK